MEIGQIEKYRVYKLLSALSATSVKVPCPYARSASSAFFDPGRNLPQSDLRRRASTRKSAEECERGNALTLRSSTEITAVQRGVYRACNKVTVYPRAPGHPLQKERTKSGRVVRNERPTCSATRCAQLPVGERGLKSYVTHLYSDFT